jgi:hypothetical protein
VLPEKLQLNPRIADSVPMRARFLPVTGGGQRAPQ